MKQKVNLLVKAITLVSVLLVTLASCGQISDVPAGYAKVRVGTPNSRATSVDERTNSRFEYYFNDVKSDSNETTARVGSQLRIRVVAVDARNGRQISTGGKTITVAPGMNYVDIVIYEDRGTDVNESENENANANMVRWSAGVATAGNVQNIPSEENHKPGDIVTVPAQEPTWDYGDFTGWSYGNSQLVDENDSLISGKLTAGMQFKVPEGGVTLTAEWENITTYTLTLNLNDGSWASASDEKTQYGENDRTLPTPTPPSTLTDYVFGGWIDKDNNYGLVGTDGMSIPSGATGEKTYYAVYHAKANATATTNSVGIEFVAVKGGTVPLTADYMPVVSSFSMSKYEVTRAQWRDVMTDMPADLAETVGEPDNNPINKLNWYDAIAFCNKLSIKEKREPCYSVNGVDFNTLTYAEIPDTANDDWNAATCDFSKNGYRLPTEAEWEYAARGGINHSAFTYSGSDTVDEVAWYDGNAESKIHEVGSKQANALGIFDMSGNVWEWCWEYKSDVYTNEKIDPTGVTSGSYRANRGGNRAYPDTRCVVSWRDSHPPYARGLGLRLVYRD